MAANRPRRIRRRSYRTWLLVWLAAALSGAALAFLLYRVPAKDTRDLVLTESRMPLAVYEVRGGNALFSRAVNDKTFLSFVKQPIVHPVVRADDWQALEALLSAGSDDETVVWRRFGRILGRNATFAVYPSDNATASTNLAENQWILIAKTHPLVRLQFSLLTRIPGWSQEWRATSYRHKGARILYIAASSPEVSIGFVGGLGFLSNDRRLLQDTIDQLESGIGFSRSTQDDPLELRRKRLAGQSSERVGSFYRLHRPAIPTEQPSSVYGEVNRNGREWTVDAWVTGTDVQPSTESLEVSREMERRLPSDAPLSFWHSSLSEGWLVRSAGRYLGLEWTSSPENWSRKNPFAMFVAPAANPTSLLPDGAALFPVEDADGTRRSLRRERIRVWLAGQRLRVDSGDDVDIASLDLGIGLSQAGGIGSFGNVVVVGTTLNVVHRMTLDDSPTTGASSSKTAGNEQHADLFELRAQPQRLMSEAQRLTKLAELGAEWTQDPLLQEQIRALRQHIPTLDLLGELNVNALTTPDGYRLRVFVRFRDDD